MTDIHNQRTATPRGVRTSPGGAYRDNSPPTAREGRFQPANSNADIGQRPLVGETEEIRKRLTLLNEISRKIWSFQCLSPSIEQITQMAQHILQAEASCVFLLDNEDRDLIFEANDGSAGKQMKRVAIGAQSGIAGWVASHAEPLVVNDARHDQRFNESIDKAAGCEAKAIICAPLTIKGRIIGVMEVLNKLDGSIFDKHDLQTVMSMAPTAAMAVDNARSRQFILDSYKSTLLVLAAAVDARDPYGCGHSQRVSEYALLAANSLPISREERQVIEYAAVLHDIGKAYIPDSILLKPGPFTAEEWKVMRKHSVIGADMLRQVPFLAKASKLVLYHHERFDGNGYPAGLKGDATPFGARLIAVADAFDTMTTYHLYRVASHVDQAIDKLRRLSGTQFCPTAVQTFLSGFSKFHFC